MFRWIKKIAQHNQNALWGTRQGLLPLPLTFLYLFFFFLAWWVVYALLVNILNHMKGWSKCFSPQLIMPLVIIFVLEVLYRRRSHHYLWLFFILYHVIVLLQEHGITLLCIAPPTNTWLKMVILFIFSFYVPQSSLAFFPWTLGTMMELKCGEA